jgi:hypothetical protein
MSNSDHYFDDPAEILETPKPPRKRSTLFGFTLALIAAAIFTNSTFAGNISLTSSGTTEFGQGVLVTSACDSNFTIKPGSTFSNSTGNFKLSTLEISALDSTSNGCANKALTINFYGDTSTASLGSVVIADGGSGFSSNSGTISTSGYGTTATTLTLTLTSPAVVSSSVFKFTVESALSTCATGGICNVGDTGPGGGIVFYKAVSAFACGPTRSDSCYYLEAAPATWSGGSDAAISISWSGNTTQSVGSSGGDTATATAIGWGYRNTLAAIAQSNTANKVITRARAYNGGGLGDWFLPSKDELNQLYLRKTTVGGFTSTSYWSSSEVSATNVYEQDFSNGNSWSNGKSGADTLRPIRSF